MKIIQLGAGDEDRYRQIRLRALADAPSAFESTLEEERQFAPEVWTSRLTSSFAVNFVAENDAAEPVGMVAGLLTDPPAAAELVAMWVDPAVRGKGVARRLVETVADWARDLGVRQLQLWVTEGNEPARTLYEQTGFQPTGELKILASDPSLTEEKLVRALSPSGTG